jgi:predicted HTH transcriptional regulator
MNPGGLYGQARPENFPHVNDYRNSVVAEMMRTLNYVNMFNHGISEVQALLKDNGSPEAEFNVNLITAFGVIVREPQNHIIQKTHETIQNTIQKDAISIQKAIQKGLEERGITITDLQMKTLVFFALNPTATRNDFISSDKSITEGGTISNIVRLQELGLLRREGGKKEGRWVVDIMQD